MDSSRNRSLQIAKALLMTGITSLSFEALSQTRLQSHVPIKSTTSTWDKSSLLDLPSSRYDDYDYERYQRATQDAERRMEDDRRRYEAISRDFNRAVDEERDLNQNLRRLSRQLELSQRMIADLPKTIEQDKQIVTSFELPIVQYHAKINQLQGHVDDGNRKVQNFRDRLAKENNPTNKQAIQALIDGQIAATKSLIEIVEQRKRELAPMEAQSNQAKANIEQNTAKLQSAQRDIDTLISQVQDLQRREDRIEREIQDRREDLRQASDATERSSREFDYHRRDLERVVRNIDMATQSLQDQGLAEGSRDGRQECLELSTPTSDRTITLQGAHSRRGDDRYYRPQFVSVPHPRLSSFYPDAYDRAYRTELDVNCRF